MHHDSRTVSGFGGCCAIGHAKRLNYAVIISGFVKIFFSFFSVEDSAIEIDLFSSKILIHFVRSRKFRYKLIQNDKIKNDFFFFTFDVAVQFCG